MGCSTCCLTPSPPSTAWRTGTAARTRGWFIQTPSWVHGFLSWSFEPWIKSLILSLFIDPVDFLSFTFLSSCPPSAVFPWMTTSSWCVTSSSCWWLWRSTPVALQDPSTSASSKTSLPCWVSCRPARCVAHRVSTAFLKLNTHAKYISDVIN